tara:strand:+ start:158 stop:367 length:210 start_codon:yes stop_codon:yes gene_type:complete
MSDKLYSWSYLEEVTLEDFIKKVTPLVSNPVQNLMEMEGDMYLSDYRDLQEASNRLLNLLKQLERKEND